MSKFILFVLFAAVNTGLMASTPTSADIPVHISAINKWIIIDKANWKSPEVEISIRKEDGSILLNEKITASKKYDLKNMPDGNYIIELEDNQQVRIQKLQVNDDILYSKDISTVYKPRLDITNDHIGMNLMTQGQRAEVSILNMDYKTMFSEKIINEVSATRSYNLKNLPAGDYMIQVRIAGKQFDKLFTK